MDVTDSRRKADLSIERNTMLLRLVFIVSFICCLFLTYLFGSNRLTDEISSWKKLSPPPLTLVSEDLINPFILGHRRLFDDFITLWTIQIILDPNLKSYATDSMMTEFFRKTLSQRPKVESLYLLSCFTMAIDFDRPDACVEIGKWGIEAFPESWRIPMTLGFIYNFKLGDKLGAAGYYAIAANQKNSPAWVASLAKKLATADLSQSTDLNSVLQTLSNVPGGTKLLEMIRPSLKNLTPREIDNKNINSNGQ